MSTAYVRISYYDDTPTEVEHYDEVDEAITAYQEATSQRQQLGQQFGDCSRISWGIIKAGKLQPKGATTYQ
jgi:hypothetical protein